LRVAGRPRSAAADRAILETALRLLVEQGYDGMSIEGVAAAAGVGKPTIYRRYPSKRELVIAAVSSVAASLPAPTATDDIRADLLAFLEPAFGIFQSGIGFATLGTLLVKERADPGLMELFRTHVVRPRMHIVASILQRAIDTHELRADTPIDTAAQMIVGAIFARHVAGQPSDALWLRSVIDTLWQGLVRGSIEKS
jgi:AcrR family transcriptional regulator